jgi:universal stress protein E
MLDVPALHPHAVRYAERAAAHNPIQKILVVVEPNATNHHCLEKAARIALACGSSIELFACDFARDLPETWAGGTTLAAYRGVMRERHIADLEALATPLRARGLSVTTECHSTAQLEEAIVERAIRTNADLIVKDARPHPAGARAPSTQIDWLLIREAPIPLLLVKPAAWPSHPRICIAVDPCHPADRTPALDDELIVTGRSLGRALSGELDIVHALESPPHLPGEDVTNVVRQKAHAHARAAVEELAYRAGVSHEAIHCVPERVPEGILKLVDATGADIVVMGAAARPRFQYSAATTASLVLDQVTCDVLVVKAPGFVSPLLATENDR